MAKKKSISAVLVLTLVFGYLFLAMPQHSIAGGPVMGPGCCQTLIPQQGLSCLETVGGCKIGIGVEFLGFFPGSTCNQQTGVCSGFQPVSNVPTLSEWGLIAMAGVLGVVGFMVMRRKRATA